MWKVIDRVGEFKVNAMDVDELRKSVRKRKVRAEVVTSVSTDEEDFDEDEVEEEVNLQRGSDDCLDTTNPDDGKERFLKSTFESLAECLSGNYSDNTRSISNAWREGSTPIQLKRQTCNIQKTMMDNKLTRMRGKSSENLDFIPAQALGFKHKLANDVPAKSPVITSTPERKTFLQKACSLLEIGSPMSPQISSLRRGSGDSDPPNGSNSGTVSGKIEDNNGHAIPSRLGLHKKMLAEVKREKVEILKNSNSQPPLKDRTNHDDVPNYMKSTLAKSKKEKVSSTDAGGSKGKSRFYNQEAGKSSNLRRAGSRETLLSAEDGCEARNVECNNDGTVAMSSKEFEPAESDVHNITRGRLSHELVQACAAKMQAAADQLVLIYKRVSLDDDLDDSLREELLTELSEGASQTAGTLTLLHNSQDERSQGEIATAAMATINQFLAKQTTQQHSKIQEILSPRGDKQSRGATGR